MRITVSTSVNAPMEKVWDAFTLPEHIIHWNFASDDWYCPRATNNPRTGGKFSYTMAARDGSMSFDFAGVYTKVKKGELINYTIGSMPEYQLNAGRKVEVIFNDQKDSVVLVETFDAEDINSIEQQRAGWQSILDNFRKYVESL